MDLKVFDVFQTIRLLILFILRLSYFGPESVFRMISWVFWIGSFLAFGMIRCSRIKLYMFFPRPRTSYFSKIVWFLLGENGIYRPKSDQ